jgi:diguanylate cyclase (GGDEF)-like protein/PAS domain S-box-containing protein
MTDITASKAANQALKASEKKYQSLFQSASDAILVADPENWCISEANPKAAQLLGIDTPTLLSLKITDLCTQGDTTFSALIRAFKKGKTSFQGQFYLLSKKGQSIPIELSAQELTLQNNQYIIISIHDLSFQVDAEERLRQSAVVFENSLEGVIITDASTRILSINNAFTRITGYTEAEVLGQKPAILHSGRHPQSFYDDMWETLRTSHHWKGEIWNRRKNGETYPQLLTITSIFDKQGNLVNYVAVFSDLSALKASQQALEHQAHYDALTGLPNKLLFEARVLHRLEQLDTYTGHLAILFLDLDHFKNVNDSLGHLAGDHLLVCACERLKQCIRRDDTLARLGGDEFIILMENIQQVQESALMAEKLIQQFEAPFHIAGQDVYISVSIGISLAPQNGQSYDLLIRNADTAMYRAKAEGRNTYQYYSKEMTSLAFERLSFESMMRQALSSGGFFLAYQPQYCLHNEHLIGYEALLRWQHPTQGMIMPDKFIPIAEESGIIISLGEWVINEACNAGSALLKSGHVFERMAVNVSVPQLSKGNFSNKVQSILRTTGFPAHKLEIEITESFLMGNEFQAEKVLAELRNMGVSISIDDFGTGYSSLSYLKKLPIDKLKIDRSFIQHLPGTSEDKAIVQAVIALGKALNLEVIAEGVETPSQRDFLISEHCDAVQGYLFARPVELKALLP